MLFRSLFWMKGDEFLIPDTTIFERSILKQINPTSIFIHKLNDFDVNVFNTVEYPNLTNLKRLYIGNMTRFFYGLIPASAVGDLIYRGNFRFSNRADTIAEWDLAGDTYILPFSLSTVKRLTRNRVFKKIGLVVDSTISKSDIDAIALLGNGLVLFPASNELATYGYEVIPIMEGV